MIDLVVIHEPWRHWKSFPVEWREYLKLRFCIETNESICSDHWFWRELHALDALRVFSENKFKCQLSGQNIVCYPALDLIEGENWFVNENGEYKWLSVLSNVCCLSSDDQNQDYIFCNGFHAFWHLIWRYLQVVWRNCNHSLCSRLSYIIASFHHVLKPFLMNHSAS